MSSQTRGPFARAGAAGVCASAAPPLAAAATVPARIVRRSTLFMGRSPLGPETRDSALAGRAHLPGERRNRRRHLLGILCLRGAGVTAREHAADLAERGDMLAVGRTLDGGGLAGEALHLAARALKILRGRHQVLAAGRR